MRARRVWAVARRDLSIELAGRRGAILPLIASLVLLPIALVPASKEEPLKTVWRVSGDVPPSIASRDDVVVVEHRRRSTLHVVAPDPATGEPWLVEGPFVPEALREPLDALDDTVAVERFEPSPFTFPKRSLFLALIASSILTGALSQSIPGERSQRTLETLLTSSITRGELILGKWVAWGGFGATAAIVATLVALLVGTQTLGVWVLAVPWVSMGTVALGFWLVRRAADVVGGATMAIRMLPAALTFLGLLSWWLGQTDPWRAALVPLGGALLAAGDAWDGAVGPTLLAIGVTAAMSAFFLRATARDLDPEGGRAGEVGLGPALLQAGLAALVWWVAVLGGLLWAAGGAPERTATIPASNGVLAGGLGLAAIAAVRLARTADPLRTMGLTRAPGRAWLFALPIGVVLGVLTTAPLAPLVGGPLLDPVVQRLGAGLNPGWAGLPALLVVLVGQELLFRGWMRQRAGDLTSAVLFAAVVTPFDPLAGLVGGVLLAALAQVAGGSVLPGMAARAIAVLAAGMDEPPLMSSPVVASILVLLGLILIRVQAGGSPETASTA